MENRIEVTMRPLLVQDKPEAKKQIPKMTKETKQSKMVCIIKRNANVVSLDCHLF
jgi:hypothetical protein